MLVYPSSMYILHLLFDNNDNTEIISIFGNPIISFESN